MRRLFVFRPEPGASQTVERAKAVGLDVTSIPLFEVEPVEWEAPDPADFDAILLTSANAVNGAGEQLERLRALPVYAVGEATATAANVAGLGVALTGNAGIDGLLAKVPEGARLIHLCGEDRRPVQSAHAISAVVVYRSRALASPALNGLDGNVAVVHSPRAAQRLAELTEVAQRANTRVAAISLAAAEAAGPGWREVRAASEPTDAALLALAARLCDR